MTVNAVPTEDYTGEVNTSNYNNFSSVTSNNSSSDFSHYQQEFKANMASFMTIPVELRLEIYERIPYTVKAHTIALKNRPGEIVPQEVTLIRDTACTAILQTCRQVHIEATAIITPRLLQYGPRMIVTPGLGLAVFEQIARGISASLMAADKSLQPPSADPDFEDEWGYGDGPEHHFLVRKKFRLHDYAAYAPNDSTDGLGTTSITQLVADTQELESTRRELAAVIAYAQKAVRAQREMLVGEERANQGNLVELQVIALDTKRHLVLDHVDDTFSDHMSWLKNDGLALASYTGWAPAFVGSLLLHDEDKGSAVAIGEKPEIEISHGWVQGDNMMDWYTVEKDVDEAEFQAYWIDQKNFREL